MFNVQNMQIQCINVIITVKWKTLDFAILLRLLRPVESSWEKLASFLVKDDLQYKVDTIRTDANRSNSNALVEALKRWLDCTKRNERNWQILCDTAKKYEDEYESQTLKQYLQEKHLESKFYVAT